MGQKLTQKAVNELNDELKDRKLVGDNQRQVGTYENATKALKLNAGANRQLAQMIIEGKRKEEYNTALSIGTMKDAVNDANTSKSFADDTQKFKQYLTFSIMQQTLSQTSIARDGRGGHWRIKQIYGDFGR